MRTKVYGYLVEAKKDTVVIKTPRNTVKIVATRDLPPKLYSGSKLVSLRKRGKKLTRRAEIQRFIDKIEGPELDVQPIYSWEGTGCKMLRVYRYRRRIHIIAGCYDYYYIFEVKKDKVVIYKRLFFGVPGHESDEVYKVGEVKI